MTTQFSIGQAAKRTGVKVPTIRYYEEIGLLPDLPRTEGNRRYYDDRMVDRLAFIRHARELGFHVDSIRRLLALQDSPNQSCETADALAKEHLGEVVRRIESLEILKDELEQMIEGCSHGKVRQCRVIEVLADHGKCVHDHDRIRLPEQV